ncbi:hypothetical protein K443DRAFT_104412 [Laccaria amethystina LaAM-08-1]|uniref:NADAR domain-containing protein n=1 Tax=Laccaria amethystina LaAM-08-1 TaxID=1095629 RepID=A0A0C9XQ48_9AGAR|nr:hypothetical protein K443DRAFT_104412 [Laccaria amethystina LaAM-08-1]
MHSRKTITIVTSPSPKNKPLPALSMGPSPTTKQAPVQYRIEERKRTVYVTSDAPPSEWNPNSLNTIFSLTEVPENEEAGLNAQLPIRRTGSYVETQVLITEDSSPPVTQDSRENSPRISTHRSRRPGAKNTATLYASNSNTPPGSPPPQRLSPQVSTTRPRILFYNKCDPHYGFTNFSAHSVVYKGKRYPTSEHLFQSFKFQKHRPNLAEHIRTCSERPSVAFSEARRFQPEVRIDWKQVNIEKMDEALWYKFTQHPDLKAELLSTGDAELVEDSDKDAFWGVGADRRGRNELGKALERLRAKLREAP